MKKATAALLGILLLAGCSDAVTQPAEDNANRKEAGMGKTTCKNLGKVGDLDDLLFQMYSNLDSHCLFEMPVGELERIWGIPVYDYTPPTDTASEEVNRRNIKKRDEYALKRQADQDKYKRLHWEVIKSNDYDPDNEGEIKNVVFEIFSAKDYGVFMQGKYPKFLPPPIIKEPESEYFMDPPYVNHEVEGYTPPTEFEKNGFLPPSDTVYKQNTEYFWLNPGRDVKLPYLTLRTIRTRRDEDLVYISEISMHRNIDRPEILTLPKP
ncbi:hypothetical protein [Neisseria elongata]|uniref:hypothetical protein n=1 Tax=Neisseria elongata TaxID=495 RepID=UPI0036195F95